MAKQYPQLYRQLDYSDLLGDNKTVTIASGGCFVTSLAMKACLYQHTITPPQLNQKFKDDKVYLSDPISGGKDLLSDSALAQEYNDVKYLKTFDYEPIPTDLVNIANLLNDASTTLTCRINLGGGNYHFVEVVACDPNARTMHIANPLSGTLEDFSQRYGSPITAKLHILVYTGPVMAEQPVSPVVPSASSDASPTAPSPLAQRFTQAIQKSTNFDTVATFLGMSNDQRITTEAGQQVVDRIKSLQNQIETLQEQLKTANNKATPPTVTVVTTPVVPTTPTFANGSAAVASSGTQALPKGSNLTSSSLQQSSMARSNNWFARIFRLLLY